MGPFGFVADYIEKARSYIYGIYLFWLGVFSIPILFTILFVDQDLIYKATGKLKGEFIIDRYFDFNQWYTYLYILLLILGPPFMTRMMIWVFPKKIIKPAYEQELHNQYDREFMKLEKEKELTAKREKVVDKEEKVVQKAEENLNKQKSLETREKQNWQSEYRSFKFTRFYQTFQNFIDTLYRHEGYYQNGGMNSNELAYVESTGLAEINRQNSYLSPTEKGKYFIAKYQEDKF